MEKLQENLIKETKLRLIKLYQDNYGTISKEIILEMLFEFEKENNLILSKKDFDEVEFELVKHHCRNCGRFNLRRDINKKTSLFI